MRNVGLGESQSGIKIAGRNINNLRYAHDTTLMTDSLLVRVKEESEKSGLKHNIQKTKIMASGLITSWKFVGVVVQLLSRVRPFVTPWTASPRLPCPPPTPRACSTHVHQVGNAIQTSHSLSSHSPSAFNLFQHQSLFQWIDSSCQVAKVSELQHQHQPFQWIFRIDFL